MSGLRQYGMVRVRRLFQPPPEYDGWHVNLRPPQVGDVGTIVDILQAPDAPDRYVVESCRPDGMTVWLGDLAAEELQPLPEEPDYREP
jgi:hypothetical protein